MKNPKKFFSFILIAIGISVLNLPSYPSILNVGPDGYPSIQNALEYAHAGDTVLVSPGTYIENVVITAPDLLLVSEEFQNTGATTLNTTVINARGTGDAVQIMADGVTLRGFTLHNYISGVYIDSCSALIDHCIIHNTGVTGVNPRGIQAYLTQSSQAQVKISNNRIYENARGGNWLYSGGRGINVYSDKAGDLCKVLIYNNTIHHNDQRGISIAHISSEITNNLLENNGVFYENRAYNVGILLYYNKGSVLVQNNEILGIEPGNPVYAGGIYLFADVDYGYQPGFYATITIQGNVIDTQSCAPGININSPHEQTFDISIIGNTISGTTIIPWSGEKLGGIYVGNMNPSYVGYVDTIEKNTLKNNIIGLFVRRTDVASIQDNNILNSMHYGLFFHKRDIQNPLDATLNWWGHPSGPGGGVTDPQTGTLAQGSGDSISKNICFDPWLQEPVLPIILIDIKPGSFPNTINVNSRGRIPVAVLSTSFFNASTIELNSIRFGKTGNEAHPVHWVYEDMDSDGDLDLIVHFETSEIGFQCGDSMAFLKGKTLDGQELEGSDTIKTVGCK